VRSSTAAVEFWQVFLALGDAEGTSGRVVGGGDVIEEDSHYSV